MAQMVKNLPAVWETWVQSLGWEDPLQEGIATHTRILAWRIPGQKSVVYCSPCSHKESDTTEKLSTAHCERVSRLVMYDSLRPMGCSLPGSSVHGVLQRRILEWVAILYPGDLCDPGIETGSPALQADSLPSEPLGKYTYSFSSVQSLSHVPLFATPWTVAHQASLSITNSQSLLKFMSIEQVMPSNHLIHSHPLLLLPSIFPIIRVFSNESALHIRWPKDWSLSFSFSPANEYSGLISFRIDCFDLFAVQGTLKSLLQHCSSKASIFSAQLSLGFPDSSVG